MKANELMIGDLVTAHGKPIHVCGVFDNRIYGDNGCDVREAAVHAIPLTEEILKANGFIVDERYDDGDIDFSCNGYEFNTLNCIKYHNKEGYQFSICGFNDYNSVSKRCLYVHELQHALRLCGLNELADNIKIE